MGKKFKYISDDALKKCEGQDYECHHCGTLDKIRYDYFGQIVDPDLSFDPEFALEGSIDNACEDCIKSGNLDKRGDDMIDFIEAGVDNPDEVLKVYNRMPTIPSFVQYTDLPMCCNQLTEYLGELALFDDRSDWQYWERGKPGDRYKAEDVPSNEELHVLGGSAAFKCLECQKKYWTFQFT